MILALLSDYEEDDRRDNKGSDSSTGEFSDSDAETGKDASKYHLDRDEDIQVGDDATTFNTAFHETPKPTEKVHRRRTTALEHLNDDNNDQDLVGKTNYNFDLVQI